MASSENVPRTASFGHSAGDASPKLRKAEISGPGTSSGGGDAAMPPKADLERQFRLLMEAMNVSPEHEKDLLAMDDERKWKLIRGQRKTHNALPPDYFVDQMRRHLDPEVKSKKVKKTKLKDLEVAYEVIKQLEVALRTNPASWVEEFCDHPNIGHVILIEFLEDLPHALESRSPFPVLARVPEEHHLCILCIKALMRHDYGFRKVLDEVSILNRIILNLSSPVHRTRAVVMQIAALVANNPSAGAERVLDAFQFFSVKTNERNRFETIVALMKENRQDDDYILACLTCFVSIINNATNLSMLVYLQMDLSRAGVDDVVLSLEGHPNRHINKLQSDYRAKLLDVDDLVQSRDSVQVLYQETMEKLASREATLEHTTRERDELRRMHKDGQMRIQDLSNKVETSRKEKEHLNLKISELVEQISNQQAYILDQEKQLREVEEQAMRTAEQLHQQQLMFKRQAQKRRMGEPFDVTNDQPADEIESLPQTSAPPLPGAEEEEEVSPEPAAIPAAPPLPPNLMGGVSSDVGLPPPVAPPMNMGYAPEGMKPKRRIQPNVALPMVNWVPLRKITETIFEELDDETILAELDFNEFESQFKIKDGPKVLEISKGAAKQKKKQITLIESNKAKNCIITTRRVGMDFQELRDTVESTDLTMLSAEHAELLFKYVPNDEESAALEKHSHHKDRLAEAERFMLETMALTRFEKRLQVMAYVGNFDELVLTVIPQMESVFRASEALMHSERFKKLLEIILAFGNYMNSAKRGPAYGFRLPTFERLLDTKSHDRKQTLMHFIVKTVESKYPQAEQFLDDLRDIRDASRVSLVTLQGDVKGLRKGIELVLYESEKQQNNFILHCFYQNAVGKVGRITERFNTMTERYNKCLQMYNEIPEKTEPFEFFSVFDKFMSNWKACKEDLRRQERLLRGDVKAAEVQPGIQSLLPKQFVKNDDVSLPAHPVLGLTSKRLA